MNGNKDTQSLGINDNNRSHPDDEYEDDGSGIEDDAPESFQAMVVSEPPWATFPDLLRVPTSINNNIAAEDDSPESLSFAATQSFRSNESSSGYRSATGNPSNQASSSNANAPIRSSSSRNRPSFTHPDVSQTEQSNLPSASPQPGSSSTTPMEPLGTASSSSSRSFLPNSTFNQSSRYQPNSNQPDHTNRIVHHPHRSSINSLNLSSALCSSSYSFHPPSSSASISSLNISLAPIASALAQVQSSVDALSKQVNERLDALESRINNLDFTSSPLNYSSCISADNNTENSEIKSSREIPPESLKAFIKEQKKEMHNERRAFLLSFAEALRNAAESVTRPEPSTSGLNGPKF